MTRLALILAAVAISHAADTHRSWASDNGNGTYSNPLFYDEFSDPDMIRVGSVTHALELWRRAPAPDKRARRRWRRPHRASGDAAVRTSIPRTHRLPFSPSG